ncbi:MAG: hypothetical protein COA57_15720, partial [Flavobacteriales bacterium]
MKKHKTDLIRLKSPSILLLVFGYLSANTQVLYNNAIIDITQGTFVTVEGSALNTDSLSNMGNLYIDSNFVNNGNATGGGNYFVAGDWENNMVFTADTSTVELNGANQLIKGSSVS